VVAGAGVDGMTLTETKPEAAEDLEYRLLIDGIRLKYGYDFSQYAESSFRRRLVNVLTRFDCREPLVFLQSLLRDPQLFRQALPYMTVGTTEMFRDPEFFAALRTEVVPTLQTFPALNVWVAGCSTGEEVYGLAILLKEEGLLKKSVLFATDINPKALGMTQEGIYADENFPTYAQNYKAAGGKGELSDYFTAGYGYVKMDAQLKTNMVLSEHNLVTDHVFAECHLILCRNVLIYFNRNLQDRALELFQSSLWSRGFLGLGSKESLRFSSVAPAFETVNAKWRIFRKRGVVS
jgi:chemotaxis protein methyltransferase CheR